MYTVTFSAFPCGHSIHVFNHIKVGLVIDPVDGPSHSNLGQLKCVRSPGIFGAISAIIIEYIISVYTPLRYHRMRAICSSSSIIYMRSLAPFGYICSIKSPLLIRYSLHANTHYELVNIDIYLCYRASLKYDIYNNDFQLQDCS